MRATVRPFSLLKARASAWVGYGAGCASGLEPLVQARHRGCDPEDLAGIQLGKPSSSFAVFFFDFVDFFVSVVLFAALAVLLVVAFAVVLLFAAVFVVAFEVLLVLLFVVTTSCTT